jgi:hypothetical protein
MFYFCAVRNFSKIIILLFTLFISCINSGLLKSNSVQESLTNPEESYPSSHRFSIQNIFLCPISDLTLKHNLIPQKTEKFLQKIKIPWDLRPGALINKNNQDRLKSEDQDPTLVTDLFGPPDISFPFNYFW